MKFEIGDVISGIEYAGTTGVVYEITTNGVEVVYTLKTDRNYYIEIGFDRNQKLLVLEGYLCGGAGWKPRNWKLKKIGRAEVSHPRGATIFRDVEPDRE